ncbi:MAG: RidA family protein [Clostridiales bacterium]|nr:RidA family protein [Clostridiales bacterium]
MAGAKEPITLGAAAGPYSPGIIAGGFIFVSGQLPVSQDTGELITDDIKAAVTAALLNVENVLKAGGAGKEDIVKIVMFLSDIKSFSDANEAYSAFFDGITPPARSCFEVANLPKYAIVEVEAIAVKP